MACYFKDGDGSTTAFKKCLRGCHFVNEIAEVCMKEGASNICRDCVAAASTQAAHQETLLRDKYEDDLVNVDEALREKNPQYVKSLGEICSFLPHQSNQPSAPLPTANAAATNENDTRTHVRNEALRTDSISARMSKLEVKQGGFTVASVETVLSLDPFSFSELSLNGRDQVCCI